MLKPQKPLLVMEYWSGWFDVWGEAHHVFDAQGMWFEHDSGLPDEIYIYRISICIIVYL